MNKIFDKVLPYDANTYYVFWAMEFQAGLISRRIAFHIYWPLELEQFIQIGKVSTIFGTECFFNLFLEVFQM